MIKYLLSKASTGKFRVVYLSTTEEWDEEKAGRVYFGFYAPGKGPMTPQVRLWARMAKVSCDNLKNPNINNYWTTVGYFNSIKELGGVLALYRDDIKSRLENIGGNADYKKLTDPSFQKKAAQSIYTGIVSMFQTYNTGR